MIPRAKDLIHRLEKSRSQVIIPALVLAELLMPVSEANHGELFAELSRKFMIVPFDAQAAFHFATLWKQHKQKQPTTMGENKPTRAKMKIDFMIVATAISRKANCIYSSDSDVANFAKGYLEVRKLPITFTQGRLL
ncbi:hypothetical protein S7335_4237 [Synechococcus sp. PCC 7335]|nr:hypothetical protein S7335_4237 [Synechococcus sp. PCC 7335]